ncbi:hypothetical protein I310_05969 [Cryptococcus deuterogattii CA1014]|nr:hypothetical protein I310_05969 [Cryptococcus deuterogattii CA1014]
MDKVVLLSYPEKSTHLLSRRENLCKAFAYAKQEVMFYQGILNGMKAFGDPKRHADQIVKVITLR